MPDQSRLQVRKDDTENTWADVGNKSGNESLPINSTALDSLNEKTEKNYQFVGPKEVGTDTYLGHKEWGGTAWRITKIDADDVFTYAYGDDNFATAWADPTILSYDLPPDS
jgi:hypothetical protein